MIKKLINIISIPYMLLAAGIIIGFLELLTAYITMDFGIALTTNKDCIIVGIALSAAIIIKNIISLVENILQARALQQKLMELKTSTVTRIMSAPYEQHVNTSKAVHVTTLETDIERIINIGMIAFCGILSEGIVALFLVGLCLYMSPIIAITVIALCGVLFYCLKRSTKLATVSRDVQAYARLTLKRLNELLDGYKEIYVYGKSEYFVKQYIYAATEKSKSQRFLYFNAYLPRFGIEIIVAIFLLIILFTVKDNLVKILSSFLYSAFRLMPALNRLINYYNQIKQIKPSVDSIHEILYTKSEWGSTQCRSTG